MMQHPMQGKKSVENTHAKDKLDSNDDPVLKKLRASKRREKREAKLARRLASLGLDINGDEIDNYSLRTYPVREWKFVLPGFQDPVALNPIVTFIGVVFLWGIVGWCARDSSGALKQFTEWKQYFALTYTWFYQGSKAIMFFFMIFITYRYGNIHLGRSDETPEFSNLAYFVIVFTLASGSPLLHAVQDIVFLQGDHYFAQAGYRSQDEVDMFSITMQGSNWGITNWTHFTIVGICMSLAGHRFRLPMTFRSCFYPILRHHTWGWMGDFVDGITIVLTVAGLVSTMCIAATQVVAGLVFVGYIEDTGVEETISLQNATIWIITALSLATVISGLQGTMLHISYLSAAMSFILMLCVLLLDDTKFLLNLIVQEVGFYFQINIFQNNFWTDAFGQLREGSGRAIDDKAADPLWMDYFIIFFVAWAVTWAPFVGMCMACVSRGRKLWEVVVYGFVASVSACVIWFTVWGGVFLRQARQGKELQALGDAYYNNSGHFLADGSENCYNVPQQDIIVDGDVIFTNHLPGVTPVCQFDVTKANFHVYNVFNAFSFPDSFGSGGYSNMLSIIYLCAIPVAFMTTSAASSLVVDILASNGRKNVHWARRMFWVVTIGILATIISSAGTVAFNAVYAASIASALPFAVLCCYLMQSITLMCRAAEKHGDVYEYQFQDQPEFGVPIYGGVFNALEHICSFGKVNCERDGLMLYSISKLEVVEFVKGYVMPFYQLHRVLAVVFPHNPRVNLLVALCYMTVYVGWVCLLIASQFHSGFSGLAWAFFFFSGGVLGLVRNGFRGHYNLRSNAVGDIVASLILWPQVLTQMQLHVLSQQHAVPSHRVVEKKAKKERRERCDDEIPRAIRRGDDHEGESD